MDGRPSFHAMVACVGGCLLLALFEGALRGVPMAGPGVDWQDSAIAPHFPQYLPVPDADPSVRHKVIVRIPTRLSAQREAGGVSVGFESSRKLKISVGKKMILGVKYEMRLYAEGGARPAKPGMMGYASGGEPVGASEEPLLLSGRVLVSSGGGVPGQGRRYVVEGDISIFETDIPPQHMWGPQSGRYRVIWSEKVKVVR